jgi:hypothetical protein
MNRETIFSPDRKYRYTLWREWPADIDMFGELEPGEACAGNTFKYVQFIGLNPSTADETKDDPTIRRCIGFAKAWGFGALAMTNIFAWRDTDPEKMKQEQHPIGPDNDRWLQEIANGAGVTIAAWGKHGAHLDRAKSVMALIPNLHCLRRNKDGSPEHPLYLPASLTPVKFLCST